MERKEIANQILSWTSTTGTKKSVIIVEDKSKDASDVEQKRIELCEYSSDEDQWKTEQMVDYIDEVNDFGIPETFID